MVSLARSAPSATTSGYRPQPASKPIFGRRWRAARRHRSRPHSACGGLIASSGEGARSRRCNSLSCSRISGKPRHQGELQLLFAIGIGGGAEHVSAVGHVVRHAGLRPEHGAGADMHVIAHAHLPGHHDIVAGGRAAGDADLRADHIVPADAAVVGDHHLVIDLRAVADDGGRIGAAIDGRAGADFDVAADLDVAQLRRKLDAGRRPACSRIHRRRSPRRHE